MTVIILVVLGYPERARKRIREALTLAQQLSHPFSLSFALGSIAISYQFLQEDRMVQEQAEALIALASKHQFPLWSSIGTILHGWTLTEQGQEEGIVQLRLGLNDHRTTRAEAGRTYYLSLLVETHEKTGRTEEGLTLVAEVLDIVRKNKECVCEAELYRVKGELTLQKLSVASSQLSVPHTQHRALNTQTEVEAEACFQTAIEIARRQQAKLWELRATISLARLWKQKGKKRRSSPDVI